MDVGNFPVNPGIGKSKGGGLGQWPREGHAFPSRHLSEVIRCGGSGILHTLLFVVFPPPMFSWAVVNLEPQFPLNM